jgi:sugar phosphate permease
LEIISTGLNTHLLPQFTKVRETSKLSAHEFKMPMNVRQDNNTPQQPNATSKWVLVWVLSIIGMLNYGVRTSMTAVYPLLKTELGFTRTGLGALGSFFPLELRFCVAFSRASG